MLNVAICNTCGALVAEDFNQAHGQFHEALETIRTALEDQEHLPYNLDIDMTAGFDEMLATLRDRPED